MGVVGVCRNSAGERVQPIQNTAAFATRVVDLKES